MKGSSSKRNKSVDTDICAKTCFIDHRNKQIWSVTSLLSLAVVRGLKFSYGHVKDTVYFSLSETVMRECLTFLFFIANLDLVGPLFLILTYL